VVSVHLDGGRAVVGGEEDDVVQQQPNVVQQQPTPQTENNYGANRPRVSANIANNAAGNVAQNRMVIRGGNLFVGGRATTIRPHHSSRLAFNFVANGERLQRVVGVRHQVPSPEERTSSQTARGEEDGGVGEKN